MVTQTPIEPQVEQPGIRRAAHASPSARDSAAQAQQAGGIARGAAATYRAQATSSTQRAAQPLPKNAAIFAGAALVVTIALFGIGLTRRHVAPAYHRVMSRAEQIDVPLLFPLIVAEFIRELIADRREMPLIAEHPARQPEALITPHRTLR